MIQRILKIMLAALLAAALAILTPRVLETFGPGPLLPLTLGPVTVGNVTFGPVTLGHEREPEEETAWTDPGLGLSVPGYPARAVTLPESPWSAWLRLELTPAGELYCRDEFGIADLWAERGAAARDIPLSAEPYLLATEVVDAAPGFQHVIFLKRDGSVWTFGNNEDGQLGNGTIGEDPASNRWPGPDFTNNFALSPIPVIENCVAVSAGHSVCAALASTGTLYTWGDNSTGMIGNGERGNGIPTLSDRKVPDPYPVMDGVSSIRLVVTETTGTRDYDEHFEAATPDGTRYVWGGKCPDTPTLFADWLRESFGE